ncbi:phage scaffolding protein [Staphylococcus saprophyticus]|nr:phage scaffolding protein [Staphylococcus saprophyticus]
MSFTRDDLRNIGVEDSKVEEIMSLHGKDVQELKDKEEQLKAQHSEAKQEVKLYKDRIEEQNSKLDELRNQVNSGEDLNEKIKALQDANKQKDEQHQQEMNKVKLRYEIDKELDRAGAKNRVAVMALVDENDVQLSDEEGLKGLGEQLEKLKESDSYLFNDDSSQNEGSQNDGTQGTNNTNNQSSGGIDYNAGQVKGNNGGKVSEGTLGRKNAERLFNK